MNTNKKPFQKERVDLAGCLLVSGVAQEAASSLASELHVLDPWLTLEFSASSLLNYFIKDDPALHRFTVFSEGKIAGVLCVRYPWLRGPYIEFIGLLSNYQGRGLGRELLSWVEVEVNSREKNIWIATSDFNHRAMHVYQKAGYEPVCTIEGLVKAEMYELLLRKRI